jgi:uncharacterized protein (DUF1697 family)
MAFVVFIRGINVGGHRRFRPSVLAQQLRAFDVVNIGAAGTFVVRKPGSRTKFRTALRNKLPFEAEVVMCEGRELAQLVASNPFGTEPTRPDVNRFVSILSKSSREKPAVPLLLPPNGKWYVRVSAAQGRFVVGVYRRHMKTIGYLAQIDILFGAPATTRGWNTILTIVRTLGRIEVTR